MDTDALRSKRAKSRHGLAKPGQMYRGVRLQETGERSRFSFDQIKRAVEAALVKNADALARKG